MFKPAKNPDVLGLAKTCKNRLYNLSDIKVVKLDGINRNCVWCLKLLQKNKQKWCSEVCARSALAWCAPCRNHGLRVLLFRDDFKCSSCEFNYRPFFLKAYRKIRNMWYFRNPRMPSYRIENLIKAFRKLLPREFRIEVDHIVPISLGGQGLGFENVQLLCSKCHLKKTKIDNKNRFLKNGNPRKGIAFTQTHKDALSKVRKGFDSPPRKAHREKIYENARMPIAAINLSTKEQISFESLEEAAEALNLQACNISRVLKGSQNRKQHKGWTFKHT